MANALPKMASCDVIRAGQGLKGNWTEDARWLPWKRANIQSQLHQLSAQWFFYMNISQKKDFFFFSSSFFAATEFDPLPVQRSSRVGSLFSNEEHKKGWFMTYLLFCHTFLPRSWRHSDADCSTQTNSTHGSYFRNSGTWLKTSKTRNRVRNCNVRVVAFLLGHQ